MATSASATATLLCSLLAAAAPWPVWSAPAMHTQPLDVGQTAPVETCLDGYDDVQQAMLLQIRAGLQQAMQDAGLTPTPAQALPCKRRRFMLSAVEMSSCSNSTSANNSQCFVLPEQVGASESAQYRILLRVHLKKDAADWLSSSSQSLTVTEHYTTEGSQASESVVRTLQLPNDPARKSGWMQLQLHPVRSLRNNSVLLHSVSVSCAKCVESDAVDQFASVDLLDRRPESLHRQKRSLSYQRRKSPGANLNTSPCRKYDMPVELQKFDKNVISPDGAIIFSFCAGFCSSDSTVRHGIVHRFTGTLFACCTPTAIERVRVEVRTNATSVTSFELPVRVTDCKCE